jgi:hypothetical protein
MYLEWTKIFSYGQKNPSSLPASKKLKFFNENAFIEGRGSFKDKWII